jgi:hypothetical protein
MVNFDNAILFAFICSTNEESISEEEMISRLAAYAMRKCLRRLVATLMKSYRVIRISLIYSEYFHPFTDILSFSVKTIFFSKDFDEIILPFRFEFRIFGMKIEKHCEWPE